MVDKLFKVVFSIFFYCIYILVKGKFIICAKGFSFYGLLFTFGLCRNINSVELYVIKVSFKGVGL